MDKRVKMAYLVDIYSPLLTEKQQIILSLYYNEDLSLSEIADDQNVSRQAAFDLIKRTEQILEKYDSALGLFDKYIKNSQLVEEIIELSRAHRDDRLTELAVKLKENL